MVTNNYHMPRSLAELRPYVDAETQFIPYPVVNTDLKTQRLVHRSERLAGDAGRVCARCSSPVVRSLTSLGRVIPDCVLASLSDQN